MKNRHFKCIVSIISVLVILATFTISTFGAGYYPQYELEDTGENVFSSYSFLSPNLPISSMVIYSKDNSGLITKREISFQNNAGAEYSQYMQSLPNSWDRYNTTTTFTSTNTGIDSIRNMSGLKNLFIEKNSQLYYDIGLNYYDASWQDIITYNLPANGIKAIRSGNFHSNGELELPINSIEFNMYPEETVNGKIGRYFNIYITTELGKFLFIDTKQGVFRNEFYFWSFSYGDLDPEINFEKFTNKLYPLPDNINPNLVGDESYFVTNDMIKNHIFFKLLQYKATPMQGKISRIKLDAIQRKYTWTTQEWTNAQSNYLGAMMTLSVNEPNFIEKQIFRIEYVISPFVIKSKKDFTYLSQNAPALRKLSGMELTTEISARISFLSQFENLQTENDGGDITQYYTSMGVWQETKTYTETRDDGAMFFSNYRDLDINGTITFRDSEGLEHENPYSYNETPQPLLFTNMIVAQNIDCSKVSNEHDFAGLLVYDVIYEPKDSIADTQIQNYVKANSNFRGDDVQSYAKFERDEFNPPEPEPWNFAKFFDGTLSFLNTPIFGSISIGTIILTVLGIGVLFGLLKYFAGG